MKKQMRFASIDDPAVTAPMSYGKDEMNFAEFPIALLTDKVPKGQTIIKFEDQIYDEKRKKLVSRRRIIEGSEEYGLPTATDDLVVLALIQLTKLRGDFTKRELEFTRLELIKLLGWADEGRSYDRIKLSLLRIKAVNYVYDNAWWDGRQKMWTTRAFNIIDNVEINDSRTLDGQNGLLSSRIVWNEVVFDSFQSGFLRDIDFQLCMRLEHPTALRLYRFLGKRFYARPEWLFDLKELSQKHMNMCSSYEGGTQLARKLKPAIAELEAIGFLEVLSEKDRFIKKGRDWSILFVQKHHASQAMPAELGQAGLLDMLTSRGVTAKTAADMLRHYPEAFLQLKIDVFDWLIDQQDKRVAKNPAGYLVKSISDDYAAPNGFISKAEQQQQQEAKQAKERQDASERRSKHAKEAADRAEKLNIDAYWASLTPEQQAAIDAQADPVTLALPAGPMRRVGLHIFRGEHIRQLLNSRKTVSAEA